MAMDQAGLLNTMTAEQLVETCKRLQRSCDDMNMLLLEFEEEQQLLRREQERLHHRIEKETHKAESSSKDQGAFWNLIRDLDQELKISNIFKAKEERQAAKRRKLCTSGGKNLKDKVGSTSAAGADGAVGDVGHEDVGPFSDACVRNSWGCDVSLGALRQTSVSKDCDLQSLSAWVREGLCVESVAEAEHFADTVELAACKANLQEWWALLEKGTGGVPAPLPDGAGRQTPRPSVGGVSALGADGAPSGDDSSSPRNAQQVTSKTVLNDFRDKFEEGLANVLEFAGPQSGHNRRPSLGEQPPPNSLIHMVTELITGANNQGDMPAGTAATWESVTVVLRRSSPEELWGLGWQSAEFKRDKVRIVDKLIPDSVADRWNQQQKESGHPERCIRPLDRLMSANGKTVKEDMTDELRGQEVVLEFQRLVEAQVVPQGMAANGAPGAVGRGADGAGSAAKLGRGGRRAPAFSSALSNYLTAAGYEPKVAEEDIGEGGGGGASFSTQPSSLPVPDSSGTTHRLADEDPVADPAEALRRVRQQVLELDPHAADDDDVPLFPLSPSPDRRQGEASAVAAEGAAASAETSSPCGGHSPLTHAATWSCEGTNTERPQVRRASSFRPRAGGVASKLDSFLEMATASTSSSAPLDARPKPTASPDVANLARSEPRPGAPDAMMPGPTLSGGDSVEQQLQAQSTAADNPLASAMPRVVAAKPLDAASEKLDIKQRLLIRRGGPLVARDEESLEQKLRTMGMDSDDEGSLQRLSSALSHLERTAEASGQMSAPATSSHGGSASSRVVCYRLRVQISDSKAATLEFKGEEDLKRQLPGFVRDNSLRQLFEEPLLNRAQLMLSSAQVEDIVDICDLA